MTTPLAKTGAVFYTLWGLMHVWATVGIYRLGASLEPGHVQGRVFQDAGFMLMAALVTIYVAVRMNWHNSATGYWINLLLVSVVDILFIALIVAPGYVPLALGLAGPVLWIIAVIFSSAGYLREPHAEGAARPA